MFRVGAQNHRHCPQPSPTNGVKRRMPSLHVRWVGANMAAGNKLLVAQRVQVEVAAEAHSSSFPSSFEVGGMWHSWPHKHGAEGKCPHCPLSKTISGWTRWQNTGLNQHFLRPAFYYLYHDWSIPSPHTPFLYKKNLFYICKRLWDFNTHTMIWI